MQCHIKVMTTSIVKSILKLLKMMNYFPKIKKKTFTSNRNTFKISSKFRFLYYVARLDIVRQYQISQRSTEILNSFSLDFVIISRKGYRGWKCRIWQIHILSDKRMWHSHIYIYILQLFYKEYYESLPKFNLTFKAVSEAVQ